MRRGLALLVLCVLLVLPARVQAQNAVSFSNFQVDLWPEYDRPEVLVIYRMTLAPEVSIPAQVSVRLPKASGSPFNVAMQEMDGQLYNLSYTTEEQGDWLKITFTTASRDLQLEYYDPGLQKTDQQRRYEFTWPGDYAAANLLVRVQQPAKAEKMQIVPDMGQSAVDADGLTYYNTRVGEVKQGTTFNIGLSYTKADDSLSVDGLQAVQSNAPIRTDITGGLTPTSFLPYLIGVAGLLLLVAGLFWWFWNRERAQAPAAGRRRHRSQAAQRPETGSPGGAIYCSRCGKKASSGDAFCRVCGTRLKVE